VPSGWLTPIQEKLSNSFNYRHYPFKKSKMIPIDLKYSIKDKTAWRRRHHMD
jgi:hypothetical protein